MNRVIVMPWLAILVVLLVPIGALLSPARAHGDADWIRRGGYTDSHGQSCCGKEDCVPIPAEHVGETSEGYHLHFHGLVVPHRQAQDSEDGRYWACWTRHITGGVRMRCFFRPHRGW